MRLRMHLAILAELLVFAAVIFGAAGRLDWWQGWAFIAVFFACCFVVSEWALRRDPALIAARMGLPVQKDQPLWDRIFMPVAGVVFLSWLALNGLDARFGWSRMPSWLGIPGALGIVAGFALVARVFFENTFLAPVVKLQEERRHHVVSTGPYAVVRHPMYAGAMLLIPCCSLLMGSWWGAAASLLLLVAIAVRAVLEERMLKANLSGYAEYAARVRYRLVPHIW